MTTVGYGDVAAKTPEGKAIAIAVMLIGIGFAALVIGAAAERFVHHRTHEHELSEDDALAQVRDISARLQRLERVLQQRAYSCATAPPQHQECDKRATAGNVIRQQVDLTA